MPKLTASKPERLFSSAKPSKKDYKVYDQNGLYLLVRSSGVTVWQVSYTFKSKRNTFTIGNFGRAVGCCSLAQARMKALEVKAMAKSGVDPNQEKNSLLQEEMALTENCFETIAREWHSKGTWVKKHAANILRSLESDVFPDLGDKLVTDIKKKDIITLLDKVEARGALDVAKRISQRIQSIFDYAEYKGLCDYNPATNTAKYIKSVETRHRSYFKENEMGEYLYNLDQYQGRTFIRLGLELLAHTFLRPGELRQLLWEYVNFEAQQIVVPAIAMKMRNEHVVPLSQHCINILEEIQQKIRKSDWVFPSVISAHKPITDATLTRALRIMGYSGEDVVPHGFRHTASTILNTYGFNRDHIEKQLAHKDTNKIRAVYNHSDYLSERAKMMHWYSDHLTKLKLNHERQKK